MEEHDRVADTDISIAEIAIEHGYPSSLMMVEG
jgi:hypothetical protein